MLDLMDGVLHLSYNPITKEFYDNNDKVIGYKSGKGFTYSRLLNYNEMRDDSKDKTIVEDIQQKKYDIVIYGSVHRGLPYFDLVMTTYPPSKVIFLCGEDGHGHNMPSDRPGEHHPHNECLVKLLHSTYPCFLREE